MKPFVAALLFAATFSAFGHGGEDHGAPPPALKQSVAPRTSASTGEFEVVAALAGRQLVVYVDRFASNEPVENAKVEIDGAPLNGLARETTPGTYVLDIAADMAPARHALTISIEDGDNADLLSATLDASLPADSASPASSWSERRQWVVWAVAAPLLAGVALLAMRRRRYDTRGS
jgi:hypothetical protein